MDAAAAADGMAVTDPMAPTAVRRRVGGDGNGSSRNGGAAAASQAHAGSARTDVAAAEQTGAFAMPRAESLEAGALADAQLDDRSIGAAAGSDATRSPEASLLTAPARLPGAPSAAAWDPAAARAVVARRIRLLVLIGAVLLVAGTLYAAIAQAATAGDVPLWGAFGQPLQSLLSRGRYAAIWWPRFAVSVCILVLVLWRGIEGIWGDVALAGTPAILLTSSLTSHGAALLSGPYLGIAVDWLHFVAVAIWIGGLAALVFVLSTLLRASASNGERIFARTVSRFSNLALASVIVIGVTGTFQAWLEIGSWEGLFQTNYGQSILIKIGLMAVMVVAGAFNLLWRARAWNAPQRWRERAASVRVRPTRHPVEPSPLRTVSASRRRSG